MQFVRTHQEALRVHVHLRSQVQEHPALASSKFQDGKIRVNTHAIWLLLPIEWPIRYSRDRLLVCLL